MRIRTLGGLDVEGVPQVGGKSSLLCAYLAIEGPKERRHVEELFWPGAKDPSASLRVALSRLRRRADGLVVRDGTRLRSDVAVDALDLLDDLERGITDRIDDDRGPFLQGVDRDVAGAELQEWVLETRDWLAARIRQSLTLLAERRAARLDLDEARRLAQRAVDVGGPDAIEPELLLRLHAVLERSGSAVAARVGAVARGYGMPLDALRATTGPAAEEGPIASLPRPRTAFVGRREEIARVIAALDEGRRLVTLVGGGGVGKTRLAVEVAGRRLDAGRCPDGARFVDLASVEDPARVVDRVAHAAGVVVQARDDAVEQLATALAGRRSLLILDNVEHVLKPVRAVVRALQACPALELLVTSRRRLGVADEWTLSLRGFEVPDDDVDDAQALDSDALRLLALRALRAGDRAPAEVADVPHLRRICRSVAGSPLGLELAAPWLRVLSASELADELDRGLALLERSDAGGPERQRGLRAAFEHSWSLSSPRERAALCRLAVFRGGFRRDGASAVADVALPTIARLLDASLLAVSDAGRYQGHPFLFGFVEEKLAERPDERARLRARHGRFVLGSLAELYPAIMGGAPAATAFDRIQEEEANLEAAWGWAIEAGAWSDLLAALPVVAAYAEFRARYHFGHALVDRLLAAAPCATAEQRLLTGLARATRGFTVFRAGDPGRVRADGEAALEVLPALDPDDPASVAAHWWAWHTQAVGAKVQGDAEASLRTSERARDVVAAALARPQPPERAIPHHVMAGMSHHVICLGQLQTGDLTAAQEHDRASRRAFRTVGSHAESYGCHTSGLLHLLAGRHDDAIEELEEGLRSSRRVGYVTATANLLEVLARAASGRGDAERAETVCDEALRLTDDVGDVWLGTSLRALKGSLVAARGDAIEAGAWFARSWGMADRHGLHGYGMEAVVGKAVLALAAGRREPAASCLRFARDHAWAPDWIRAAAATALSGAPAAGERPAAPGIGLDEVRTFMTSA
jgi:predicted ATPase